MKEDRTLDDILSDDFYFEEDPYTDEEVDEMLRSWDKIRCAICGKEISMLDARIIRNQYGYESFVCRNHKSGR